MLAVDTTPYEVDHELESLLEQLRPNHANMPNESSVPLAVVLVDIDAGQAMGHLAPVVVRHDLQVVTLVSVFHLFEQLFWVVERITNFGHQLLIVVLGEFDEFSGVQFEWLQEQFDFFLDFVAHLVFFLSRISLICLSLYSAGLLSLQLLPVGLLIVVFLARWCSFLGRRAILGQFVVRTGDDRLLACLHILLILHLALLSWISALHQRGVPDVGKHGDFEFFKGRDTLLLLRWRLTWTVLGVLGRDCRLVKSLALVQDHLLTCRRLVHLFLSQRNGPLRLALNFAFLEGAQSLASHSVACHASLNQERVATGLGIGEVEVLCDGEPCEIDRISLHLQQVVASIVGEERHLNGRLSSALSDSALLSAHESQVAELVAPENNELDTPDTERS